MADISANESFTSAKEENDNMKKSNTNITRETQQWETSFYCGGHTADNRLDLYMDRVLINVQARLSGLVRGVKVGWDCISLIVAKKTQPLRNRTAAVMAYISDKMATAVDRVDLYEDRLFESASRSALLFIIKQREARAWCGGHKPQLLGATAVIVLITGIGAAWVDHNTAYEYMYNGKLMGVVKSQQDVYKTIDVIGDKLAYAYGAEIVIDKENDISFHKVFGTGFELDNKEDVLNRFTYLRDMNATAYAITVDGKQEAILYSKKCAEKLLRDIQDKYTSSDSSVDYKSIDFAENIKIKEINTKMGNIQSEEEALNYMLTGAVQIDTYAVKSGDTFNQIAKDLRMTPDDLMSANPDIDPAKLQIDQELVLNKVIPVLTVQTTEVAEYKMPIEYEIIYEETATLYKDEQTVKTSGENGERLVVAQIVRNNGEEVSRKELSSTVITEPKAQVVIKGTKDLPPLYGSGNLIYPTRGRLSSRFGPRWGRMHNGIDLAAPSGTKIRAADGGKVISAGWENGLGYCVRIDHGGNKTTVYGHCSKIFVKAGEKVYQDQHIANVGNTGNSTGPHLHFEVHVKGVPQNPLKYLP